MKRTLIDLLLEGQSEGVGVYDNINWHVLFENDATSTESRLISFHESFHSYLNNSTIYGLVLQMYTHLSKGAPEVQENNVLLSLVKWCTLPHEIFATYLSVSVVSSADSTASDRKGLIKNYPGYFTFYDKAAQLLEGVGGKYLRQHCLTSLIRVVLQDETLLKEILLSPQNPDLKKIEQVVHPEDKLEFIQEEVNNGFWKIVLDKLYSVFLDKEDAILVKKSERDPSIYQAIIQPKYDSLSESIYVFIYEEIRKLLDEKGIQTLEFNQHLDYSNLLLKTFSEIYPFESSDTAFVKNPNPQDLEFSILSNFQNEILYAHKTPLKAYFSYLNSVEIDSWKDLVLGNEEDKHFFIVVRMPDVLLKQYQFSEDYQILIKGIGAKPLVMIRRSAIINEQREVEFFYIEKPDDILKLKQINAAQIVCNTSLYALHFTKWYEEWFSILDINTVHSILFDLSPYKHIANLKKQFSKFLYQTATMIVDDKKFSTILFYGQQEDYYILFILPCSTVTASSINYYIQRNLADEDFLFDKGFASSIAQQVKITIGHLLREEHYFDFRVLPGDFD